MSDSVPTVSMKLDVKENDKEFQVHAEVPGLAKVSTHIYTYRGHCYIQLASRVLILYCALQDDVKVELDADNVLHISADRSSEKKEEDEKEGWKYHRMERSSSSVHRAVKLPANVDTSKIHAACDNGVLNVTIPKLAGQETSRRRIGVA
jgi:HSP20 family molecular chaperone IbpA